MCTEGVVIKLYVLSRKLSLEGHKNPGEDSRCPGRYLNLASLSYSLARWFPKCAPRIPRDPRPFPGDPWTHFCNGYFEVYLF
jgi:hypothetical protein